MGVPSSTLRHDVTLAFVNRRWLRPQQLAGLESSGVRRRPEGPALASGGNLHLCVRPRPVAELLSRIRAELSNRPGGDLRMQELLDAVQPVGLSVRGYSPAATPARLKLEWLAFEKFLDPMSDARGLLVDDKAGYWISFERRREIRQRGEELLSSFRIHIAGAETVPRLCTRGLEKFACPDLEWWLDEQADLPRASHTLNAIATYMVNTGNIPEPGETLGSEDGGFAARVHSCTAQTPMNQAARQAPSFDPPGGTVLRLVPLSPPELVLGRAASNEHPPGVREEYFHGR